MSIQSDTDPESLDLAQLQEVFTRYVDSTRGYLQAAELMTRPSLREAFAEIAARRSEVAAEVAGLINEKGEEADQSSSIEGTVHRWWIRIRETVTQEELEAVLAECIRGEEVLLAALDRSLATGDLDPEHTRFLKTAREEVAMAIQHFKTALEN